MHDEYKAIVDAGIVLQIDDPSLPDNWDMINPEPRLEEFKKFEQVRMEALNHALRVFPLQQHPFTAVDAAVAGLSTSGHACRRAKASTGRNE